MKSADKTHSFVVYSHPSYAVDCLHQARKLRRKALMQSILAESFCSVTWIN